MNFKMPLTFSESEKIQVQPDLFKNSGVKAAPVGQVKSYNSFQIKTEPSPQLEFNFSNPKSHKLEESYPNEPDHIYISEEFEEDLVVETTALKGASEPSKPSSNHGVLADNYLTVPGTIKKGKKKGQSVEVILNMSREELEMLEANIIKKKKGFLCSIKNGFGFHILLWTILCFPFSIIISGAYSFCMGTITWYNVFKLFSENQTMGYRILFPPLLVVSYPFLIASLSLGLGLYAGIKQLSCCWDSWLKEFTDYEKGFYGWLCNALDIPECSPYEVVILSSIQKA